MMSKTSSNPLDAPVQFDAIDRRGALRAMAALGAAAAAGTAWSAAFAADRPAALVSGDGAAFDATVANNPWLKLFKGIDDSDPTRSDLHCESLSVTGRWPAELRGRFYRNGPGVFERSGQRYHHWFDGDGMVQKFTLGAAGVSHTGRFVRTGKLVAERDAKRLLYSTFGTRIESDVTVSGPDSSNVANTSVIEHAGRVLALWEGGSAFALDPKDLSTTGPVTWQEGYEQVPFSAHPKVDPQTGGLWNIGTYADKIVVWHINNAGRLERVQMRKSPYPDGMAHDFAITAKYIVLPLPPIKMDYRAIGRGATPEQAFRFETDQPLRVLVMEKADIAEATVFELPARMLFHVANACETRDGKIELGFIGAHDNDFLVHGAMLLVAGQPAPSTGSRLHLAELDFATGKATMQSHGVSTEFPRIDPRRVGSRARFVTSLAIWKPQPAGRGGLFHGVQTTDLSTGAVDRFDYGSDAVVDEHIVVPKPRGGGERDAWLVGTVFDAKRQVTLVNVLDAQRVADGPIARAALPYALPPGFHGNFTPASA